MGGESLLLTMALVGPGIYEPLYPMSPSEAEMRVEAFWLDRHAVTEAEFAAFVHRHAEWQRDRVPRIFADERYLAHWASPENPGAAIEGERPVVAVSWFAAKAYCAERGARLPTESEWELAAMASRTAADGRKDPAWRQQILDWYARPTAVKLPPVGSTPANYWGVRDLHGVIWEWVLDFNGPMGGDKNQTTCGGAAATARDPGDYATFMRVAFRSSLRADYTTNNLGFRCARDVRDGGT